MTWDIQNNYPRRPAQWQLAPMPMTSYSAAPPAQSTFNKYQGRLPAKVAPWRTLQMKLAFQGYTLLTNSARVNIALAQNWKASLEVLLPSGYVSSTPFSFGGADTKTINIGDELSYSDVLTLEIPAGCHWWIRYFMDMASAVNTYLINNIFTTDTASEFYQQTHLYLPAASSVENINGVGAMLGIGRSAFTNGAPASFLPPLVMCDYLHTTAAILSDSKGTVASGVPVTKSEIDGAGAHITRMLSDLGIPYMNYSIAGSRMNQWAALTQATFNYLENVTDVFIGGPINDVANGQTGAQIAASLRTLIGKVKTANPKVRVWGIKCEPFTTITGQSVTALTSIGTTATAVVASTAGLVNGNPATIAGASPAAYNVTAPIFNITATTFDYYFAGGTSPATGTITMNDAYGSTASQSFNAAQEALRIGHNADLDSLKADGTLFGILDPNKVVEAGGSGTSGKWGMRTTGDGVHLIGASNIRAGTSMGADFLAQGGIPNTGAF